MMSDRAKKPSVLVAEDEELMRNILRRLLAAEGYDVFTADSAEAAIEIFSGHEIAVTLTDIKMPGRDGLTLLDQIKSLDAEAVVIVMTAFASVDTAIAALRKGAYDYVTKPFVNDDLLQTVRNAATHRKLFNENRLLRREIRRRYDLSEMIGTSDPVQTLLAMVKKIADTNVTVLISGETGTGKELVARALHFNSSRCDKPFMPVNCGALPEFLLESELFGHIKGSFTGAVTTTKGIFRSADGGTVFLDEIAEMPASLQVKLLRTLQEHEVTPVGATAAIGFDARIIAASNKNLAAEVAAGRFREDLFYRLNVIELTVPPLRERRDDIPLLVRHFLRTRASLRSVSDEALDLLTAYDWPGNVRELENVIERAIILSGDAIDVESLPDSFRDASRDLANAASLASVERSHILKVLDDTGDDKARAAEMLGIDLSTLYRKLKRYGRDA